MIRPLYSKLFAEFLGTLLLLATVIGSGIMAENLAAGNTAIALLANTAATVGALYVLIEIFGPISGAHFNPLVSLVLWIRIQDKRSLIPAYVLSQLLGAAIGALLAHAMFDLPLLQLATKVRTGSGQWIAESIASAGLLLTIMKAPPAKVSSMVAAYIGAAYWFTASTSFANPAAVFGRMLSNSFAGIAPKSAPAFVIAELLGAVIAVLLVSALSLNAEKGAESRNRTGTPF